MDVNANAERPWVILVTGQPGTGKTTLGKRLAERYGMPLITKDAFKERIFDTLGYSDKAWSLRVSAASHRIIDYLVEQELAAGRSVILESNFKPEIDDQRFRRIRDTHPSTWIQVLCWARGDVLFDRYTARQHSTERHPGHAESATTEQTRAAIGTGRAALLRMPDVTLELDTTDLATIDYSMLFAQLDEYRTTTTRASPSPTGQQSGLELIGGDEHVPISVVPYNPEWPTRFETEQQTIKTALGVRALSIDHIGSTSVPGLAAKPIIDICLVVADSSQEPAYLPALESAGYVLRVREPNWHQHRMLRTPARDVHLHVFSQGSPEVSRLLALRDWLRQNEPDRELYATTKRDLARQDWPTMQRYADAKTEIIQDIMSRALPTKSADPGPVS